MATSPKKRRVRPVEPSSPSPSREASPPVEPAESAGEKEPSAKEDAPPPHGSELPTESTEPELLEASAAEESAGSRSWMLEVAGKDLGVVMAELKDDISYWVQKGRYNKVRVLRNGKPVLPDIPVGAVLALEAASLAWAGALRTAVVNVAGRLLFKVELINDAAEHLAAARTHYEKGDLDEAEAEAVKALKVDSRYPDAFLLLGITAKVRGKKEEALRHFRVAKDLDPHGEVGRNAESQARKLDPDFGNNPVEKVED